MKAAVLAAFAALLPAAVNPAPAAASVNVPVCSGADQAKAVTIPLTPAEPGRRDDGNCWIKGCHTGSTRKRGACHI